MKLAHEELAKRIMALVMQGAEPERIQVEATEAKMQMSDEYIALYRSLNLVDNLVSVYAPDPNWQWGFSLAQVGVTTPTASQTQSPRMKRVLEIALNLIERGAEVVASKDIARQLAQEGAQGSEKDLGTSVGNILARARGWQKVRPGEYAPVKEEVR